MISQSPEADYCYDYEDCLLPKTEELHERPLIYVAGYYSANPMHGLHNAIQWAEMLEEKGWCAYVPHMNALWDAVSPNTPEHWYAYDLALLKRCDAMFVCGDPKTKESHGVSKEIEFCTKYDIPVFYEIVEEKDRYDY